MLNVDLNLNLKLAFNLASIPTLALLVNCLLPR